MFLDNNIFNFNRSQITHYIIQITAKLIYYNLYIVTTSYNPYLPTIIISSDLELNLVT
jgi:hypothetical protein